MFDFISQNYNEPNWNDFTIFLYFFIVVVCFILGFKTQNGNVLTLQTPYGVMRSRKKINYGYIILTFFLFCVFDIFRESGTDVPMYKQIYYYCDTVYADSYGIEPGFLFVNRILKRIGLSQNTVIGIFGIVTLIFIFKSIIYYGKRINIGLSILAFGSLYYFPSFNMIRMYMAASIMLYAFKYLVNKSYKIYFIIFFLTCLIHFSVAIFILPVLGWLVYNKNPKLFAIIFIIGSFVAFKGVSILSNISIIARYDQYLANGAIEGGIGFMQIAINVPIFLLYFYSKTKLQNNTTVKMLLIFSLFHLLIGLLSYKIMMLGRSLVYFNELFIILIPIIIKQLPTKNRSKSYIIFFYSIYLIYRFILYLKEYLYLDGIMPYKMIGI